MDTETRAALVERLEEIAEAVQYMQALKRHTDEAEHWRLHDLAKEAPEALRAAARLLSSPEEGAGRTIEDFLWKLHGIGVLLCANEDEEIPEYAHRLAAHLRGGE